jgi:hypothetical protein
MKKQEKSVFDMIRTVAFSSNIKTRRFFSDFFADRIVQASTESTMLGFIERLCKSVDVQIEDLHKSVVGEFLQIANEVNYVLAWIRKYTAVAAMIASLKKEEYESAIHGINIEKEYGESTGVAVPARVPEISIKITTLSPFAHGGDQKAGNATLFRRQNIMCSNGAMLSLPFYAGNSLRGQIRDMLADDFIQSLGMKPRKDVPPVMLWFFHVLYSGGALEESGSDLKALMSKFGNNGAVRAGGILEFRDTIPHLSVLGSAMGNRILEGRAMFSDFRPRCKEYGTGEKDAAELFEWTFITRREDHEEHIEHHGMIANTECLKAGNIMDGGIDVYGHASDLERSAIGRGLELIQERGMLGAENRRGLGSVNVEVGNMPDSSPYNQYISDNKAKIIEYLKEVNAIASCNFDIEEH